MNIKSDEMKTWKNYICESIRKVNIHKLFEPLNPNISVYILYQFPVSALKKENATKTSSLFCNIAEKRVE